MVGLEKYYVHCICFESTCRCKVARQHVARTI